MTSSGYAQPGDPRPAGLGEQHLAHLGVLAVRGPEARKFLHGQLSQDVLGLRPDRVEWAGWHNPQGRTLALLRLVPCGPQDVRCVLPRELLADTLAGLQKYLLRARATLTDESALWRVVGLAGDAALPAAPGSARQEAGRILWRHAADGRVLAVLPQPPADAPSPEPPHPPHPPHPPAAQAGGDWQAADIAAGLPELTARTRGEFVAQMLNLDALGGISFTKGCYTGQEIIARAHYRGRVKRRAQHFRLPPGAIPSPGDTVTLADGRDAQVVLAAAARPVDGGDAAIDILAVAPTLAGDPLALPLAYPLPE